MIAKGSSSENPASPSNPVPSIPSTISILKISGVVKGVESMDPQHTQVVVVGESGRERTFLVSQEIPLFWEGKSISMNELKPGDVVDLECELDSQGMPQVEKLSIVVRPSSSDSMMQGKDSEFE